MGAVPVSVNTMLTTDDYEYSLDDSRARVLVVSQELLSFVQQISGDLHYLWDLIIVSETEGVWIPYRQAYRRAPSGCKPAFTTRDDVSFWLYSISLAPSRFGSLMC